MESMQYEFHEGHDHILEDLEDLDELFGKKKVEKTKKEKEKGSVHKHPHSPVHHPDPSGNKGKHTKQ